MDYRIQDRGDTREIFFAGDFTYSDNLAIVKLIAGFAGDGQKQCVLSLCDLASIDSAGLGMLILLNDAAEAKGMPLRIRGPQGQVRKMLEITEFNEIIPIEN